MIMFYLYRTSNGFTSIYMVDINVVFCKTAKLFPRAADKFVFSAVCVSSDCCTSVSALDVVFSFNICLFQVST